MSTVTRTAPFVVALLLALAAARPAAADQKASVEQLKALNQSAQTAYSDGDFEKTKSHLQEAMAVAKDNGLTSNKVMASIYMLFGVLKINEHKDTDAGVKYFAKALDISPAVKVPPTMATKAVKAAFAKAEDVDPSTLGDLTETEAAPPPAKGKKGKAAPAAAADDGAAEAERQRASAAEKKAADAEKRDAERQAQIEAAKEEKEKLKREVAAAKEAEGATKAQRDKLLADTKAWGKQMEQESAAKDKTIAAKDKQIADAQAKIAQLEKDKAAKDSQLGPASARIKDLEREKAEKDKQIAALTAAEKKERETRVKLEAERPELAKQIADAKGRIAQLEKDKADRDKQIAALTASEKKERDTRERLEKTMSDVAARERERRNKEIEDHKEREKLVEGGDLPGHIREAIHCDLPDEVPPGEDIYVHCVPQPGTGAKVIAFYYRSGGMALYNAVILERSRKGWYVATIPGARVSGKLLHYYVEGRNDKQAVAASYGKAASPNVITIKAAAGGGKVAKEVGSRTVCQNLASSGLRPAQRGLQSYEGCDEAEAGG